MVQIHGCLLLLALALHASHSQADIGAAAGNDGPSASLGTGNDDAPGHGVTLPVFQPYPVSGAAMWEQFTEGSRKRWMASRAKKQDGEEARYDGEWAIEEVSDLAGIEGDAALVVKNDARHHAISTTLEHTFDPASDGLVLQYEVKFQKSLECGGAYIKLLTAPFTGEFSDATPYTVMFGPDKCDGSKVHFIYRHRNPISGSNTEHHLNKPLHPPVDKLSHLYTLAIHTNNTFSISIDGNNAHTGSLLEDFDPPVNPPKEIDDSDDEKPADWEDEEKIPDPEAKKPDDWDEDAPLMVPDEDAVMPEDWLVDEPLMVPDPNVEKPSDWDDDEDGEWAAPVIPNPRCAEAAGCGPWERPLARNPNYKGKWYAPLIDNPRYKGEWKPRRIPNPDYFEDLELFKLSPIDAVGFELWTMQSGISFDNIYLGSNEGTAAQIAEDVWKPKHDSELAVGEALRPKPPPPSKPGVMDMARLFKLRFEEIGGNILSFYHAIVDKSILEAFREEKSGAFAAVMAVGGITWLVWNMAVISRFIAGLLFPGSPLPSAGGSASESARPSGASTGAKPNSTGSKASVMKRGGAKSG
ncbi:hypothetical protein IW140_004028 [Coemansia sp. RSA 1813]|nr:hypothetical protein EV178_003092 [Coemansia sp. RSA 1646]KAJ1770352.1 hypothetical protein LPJ74_003231 [Coemansia sp. RSA 1843]KAJ2089436.1 hypothetical protein IW138_003466 [Coemansia sp. RSA 986]KAJ2214927.1 hypothetical protein EV179_002602 [Coemansia sp. RSA 487]KAJ2568210.1 hypothetical protein IW140_004028 [Coemansia sp. RSA 1813]